MIQIGGVYTTFCQEGGILLQNCRNRNGRSIRIVFKSIGVRGRFDFLISISSLRKSRKKRGNLKHFLATRFTSPLKGTLIGKTAIHQLFTQSNRNILARLFQG